MDLSTRYMGLNLANPIIVGSSGLSKTAAGVKKCADAGAGAVVLKSIFEEQISKEVDALVEASHQSMWHSEAAEYITAYGHDNAVDLYLETIAEAKSAVNIPIIASVHCVTAGAWTDFARQVEQAGADALELNVFVMPSDPRRSGQENEKVYFDVVKQVKKQVSIPVGLKIGFFFSSLSKMIEELGKSGVDGLVLFNRFYSPDFDIEKFTLRPAKIVSSSDEYVRTLRWISLMSGKVGCDLAAATGIHDGATVVKQILAGAHAVQVCSALYRNGVQHVGAMLKDVEEWMQKHGFETLDAFRGKMSQSESGNPADYVRVQFMKASVGIE